MQHSSKSQSKLKELLFGLCTDYAVQILAEMKEKEPDDLSVHRKFPLLSPVVLKFGNSIQSDYRFKKIDKLFSEFTLFEKYRDKSLILDQIAINVTAVDIIMLFLEYAIHGPQMIVSKLKIRRQFQDHLLTIESFSGDIKKNLERAFTLFIQLSQNEYLTYSANAFIFGVKGSFESLEIGNYNIICKTVKFKNEVGKEVGVGLIKLRKSMTIDLKELVVTDTENRLLSDIFPWLNGDPTIEFVDLFGLLKVIKRNTKFAIKPEGYRAVFFGSSDSFVDHNLYDTMTNSTEEQAYAKAEYQFESGDLNSEDLAKFRKLWNEVSKLRNNNENVKISARRLAMSIDRKTDEDGLIDLIVGIETLLGSDSGKDSISYKLKMRTSALIGADNNELTIISKAYRFRSGLLHSGKSSVNNYELSKTIDALKEILGRSIEKYVELLAKLGSKKDVIEYLDYSIAAAANRNIRNSVVTGGSKIKSKDLP